MSTDSPDRPVTSSAEKRAASVDRQPQTSHPADSETEPEPAPQPSVAADTETSTDRVADSESDEPQPQLEELRPRADFILLQRWSSMLSGASILLVLLVATIIVAAAGAPGVALKILLPIDLLVTGIIVWVVLQWPRLVRRNFRYRMSSESVEVQQGLWWLKNRFIPRSRIQHASVLQGPFERQFGLATVAIHTAGSRASKTRLPGLDHEDALAWVRELTQVRRPLDAAGSELESEPELQPASDLELEPEPESSSTSETAEAASPSPEEGDSTRRDSDS